MLRNGSAMLVKKSHVVSASRRTVSGPAEAGHYVRCDFFTASNGLRDRIVSLLSALLLIAAIPSSSSSIVAPPRSGPVHLSGRAFADGGGPYLAVGASLFWAGWGCRHDTQRLERNLRFLSGKVDYIRVLALVGPDGWRDRGTVAADLEAAVACVTDLAYEHGLRTQWTIFGSVETAPTPADRASLVRRFAAVISPRAAKVQFVEVANEGWQNGFGGDAGRHEARALARLLRELTRIEAIAITSPRPGDEEADVKRWYAASAATLITVHPDRSQRGTGGMWRPVRQAWNTNVWATLPWIANEPIGPQSSVAEDHDPQRLTMAAALTWLCGGAGYTLHTGAGVRGGGAEDVARGRVANLWEVAHIEQTLAGISAMRKILPADLPNFRRHDPSGDFPDFPFEREPIRQRITSGGLLTAYGATSDDGRFVVMPLLATAPVPFTARMRMRLTMFDPMSGAVLDTRDLAAGETFTLPRRDATVIVGQRHSG
jgi:hypothetical protein